MATPLDTIAAKAWIARVEIRGYILTEELINSPTVAAETTYYSRNFPITNAAYVVTNSENQVTLYDDGVAIGPAQFVLTGLLGRIVFNVAPANGSVITMTYYYRRLIAYGHAINVNVDGSLEALRVFSMRLPKEIVEGAVAITGSLSRWCVDRDMIGLIMRDEDGDTYQPDFAMWLWPLGEYTGKPKYTLSNVKFSPYNLSLPDPDSIIDESLDFIALSLATTLVP